MATTVTSRATKSSNLDDQMSGANLQTEGHTPIPLRGHKVPEEVGALGNAPSHLPSWSPARRPSPSHPNTRHCLGIHITLTKDTGATPPPPYAWMAPIVEDMICNGRTGLAEAVVMGPDCAVLFYGNQSLGECLRWAKARDATVTLTGVGTWVGKLAYLAADPLTIQEGWQAINQAFTECQLGVRGPGQPHSHPLTPQPFRFHCPGDSLKRVLQRCQTWPSPHRPQRGQDCNWHQRDQRLIPPQPPSPDCGFKSDRNSVSTASSWHSWYGRWCRETGAHMKINLSVLTNQDTKDAITYQCQRWDLTVYHCAGCQDHTLCPYAIWSLEGYPGELVRSFGTDIILDDVLTILDEQFNNVKVLDPLNQELFQLQMADKETISYWGICPLRHFQVLATSFQGQPTGKDLFWLSMGHKGSREEGLYGSIPKPPKPSNQ